MDDPGFDALLTRVAGASKRLRIAMGITAVLCVLIAVGVAMDHSIWQGGWGWRLGGIIGVTFFMVVAGLTVYGAFWRQRRHIARLRHILREHPQRVRSIRLLVAEAIPYASWKLDDGSARTGLHIFVTDDADSTWVLPVSRSEAADVIADLAARCPLASVET